MAQLALLVAGGRGQLGSDLATLGVRYGTVRAPGSAELDITDEVSVQRAVVELVARAGGRQPVAINAAAYTAVDAAESDEARARAVNADGPGVLARA